jgi:hypothetical protein
LLTQGGLLCLLVLAALIYATRLRERERERERERGPGFREKLDVDGGQSS